MSLIITPKYTNTITDSKGNKLFKFPGDTTLDNIIPDLWNDIIKYLNVPLFIFGLESANYPGYRVLKRDEFDIYKNKFVDYYIKNQGIPNIFDIHLTTQIYFIIDGYYVVTCKGYTTCSYDENKTIFIIQTHSVDLCHKYLRSLCASNTEMSHHSDNKLFLMISICNT